MDKEALRIECLELALEHSMHPLDTDKVIKHAECFYNFITNDRAIVAASAAVKPKQTIAIALDSKRRATKKGK